MSVTRLRAHRQKWEQKPLLRAIYRDWYRLIIAHLNPGRTIEIGGGTGNLKEYLPDTLTSDIVCLPWLDAVLDAHTLPFKNNSLDNIVLFDVLHHLESPVFFFDEAIRTLKVRGRLILMEPYVSLSSYWVYRFLHPEPLDFSQNPFRIMSPRVDRKPFDANQAIPTLMFGRFRKQFLSRFPGLKLIVQKRLSFFAYPLSGGFEKPALLPLWAVKPTLSFERMLDFLSPILAFRIFMVLERKS